MIPKLVLLGTGLFITLAAAPLLALAAVAWTLHGVIE